MPCIIIKTNQSLPKEKQLNCCQSISLKTAALLGKPESYVVSPEKHIIYLKCKELSLFLSDQIDQKC
ncbi:MAG: hypothetical protein KZQ57_07760, partial [gamma proteobacterium symbiont of Lucinoma myriamae]|nr:hypothetical protein [gamma proteobacterium symbiont of Lucinoma myriamae]